MRNHCRRDRALKAGADAMIMKRYNASAFGVKNWITPKMLSNGLKNKAYAAREQRSFKGLKQAIAN